MTDPVDLSWAVQTAVYQALTEAGVPIVDTMAPGANVPAVQVYFGEISSTEIGSKDASVERCDLSIHVEVTGSSREPMRALQAKVKAALHDRPITAAGALLSATQLQNTSGQPTDIGTILGTQVFLVIAQPDL